MKNKIILILSFIVLSFNAIGDEPSVKFVNEKNEQVNWHRYIYEKQFNKFDQINIVIDLNKFKSEKNEFSIDNMLYQVDLISHSSRSDCWPVRFNENKTEIITLNNKQYLNINFDIYRNSFIEEEILKNNPVPVEFSTRFSDLHDLIYIKNDNNNKKYLVLQQYLINRKPLASCYHYKNFYCNLLCENCKSNSLKKEEKGECSHINEYNNIRKDFIDHITMIINSYLNK